MRIRELAVAALAAAALSVGTAKVANAAAADCEGCYDWFYAEDYFYDDVGQLGSPGFYDLVGCDENWCYYYGGGQA